MKAMILLAVSVTGLTASPVFAASSCLREIAKIQGYGLVNPAHLECMSQNADLQKSLGQLCTRSQRDFSSKLKAYRYYQLGYQMAAEEYRLATNPKQALHVRMIQAERDWSLLGYRTEIFILMSPIWRARFDCEKAQ